MVLSLEELGPAQLQATHQGPADTATAAASAAAQPAASLGAAAAPSQAPASQTAAKSGSADQAHKASEELQCAAGNAAHLRPGLLHPELLACMLAIGSHVVHVSAKQMKKTSTWQHGPL